MENSAETMCVQDTNLASSILIYVILSEYFQVDIFCNPTSAIEVFTLFRYATRPNVATSNILHNLQPKLYKIDTARNLILVQ